MKLGLSSQYKTGRQIKKLQSSDLYTPNKIPLTNNKCIVNMISCDLLNVMIFCPRTEQLGTWDER